MAKKKAFGIPKSLSDGIGETINTANNNVGQLRYEVVSLSRIELDTENPRDLLIDKNDVMHGVNEQDFNADRKKAELDALKTLSFSIKKVGVRNPIEVYKQHDKYILISGERRVLSSLLAGKTDIPAKILDAKPDELQLRFLQWIENIEREDLSIWERLYNIEQLVGAYTTRSHSMVVTPEALSDIIGCSTKQSKRYLDVVNAPEELKNTLKQSGIADLIKLALIVNTKDVQLQSTLIQEAINGASRNDISNAIAVKKNNRTLHNTDRQRGRPRTAISLNLPMKNIAAFKIMVESVLNSDPGYSVHKTKFDNTNWMNADHIKKAFNALLSVLEK